jgi:hypothetical protein
MKHLNASEHAWAQNTQVNAKAKPSSPPLRNVMIFTYFAYPGKKEAIVACTGENDNLREGRDCENDISEHRSIFPPEAICPTDNASPCSFFSE